MIVKNFNRLAAALCVATLASGAAQAQLRLTEAELYEKAKKEGAVTWYVGYYTTEIAQRIAQGFEKKYPGIKVNANKTTGQVAFQRVMQDMTAGSIQSDLFSSPDVGHFETLKKEGALLSFVPENAPKLAKSFQNLDPDNTYHVTNAIVIALTYNTEKVKPENAPTSWQDLLDPKWKGQISTGSPNFSGSVAIWGTQMRKQFGEEFFTKLAANQPLVGRSIDDTVNVLNAGERSIAFSDISTAARSIDRGNPVAISYPTDGSVIVAGPSAVLKGAKNPHAGMLLLNYLLSDENDRMLSGSFLQPVLSDTPPSRGLKPLNEVPTASLKSEELLEGIPAVRNLWREKFAN